MWRDQSIVGHATSRKVGLSPIRKQSEQAKKSKCHSSMASSIASSLIPTFTFQPEFLRRLPSLMDCDTKGKPNKSFSPRVALIAVFCYSNGKTN